MAFTRSASLNPYGTYQVEPTGHGLKFQVSVRDSCTGFILGCLAAKGLALPYLASHTWWACLILLAQFLADALLYVWLFPTQLIWIEVRPDGLVIWPQIDRDSSAQFFDRRAITDRALDFDQGLSFRYGIHDIRATAPFANEREFEIFEMQLEQAIARLWHQENLDR